MKLRTWQSLFLMLSLGVSIDWARAQDRPDPKVVDGARKEGEIVWYTTMSVDQNKEFMDRFQKKYPFLRPSVFLRRRRGFTQSHYFGSESRKVPV